MPYEINHSGWIQHLSGGDLALAFTCEAKQRFGDRPPIEEQIRRLADLVGRVADASGVNLLDLIGVDEIQGHRFITHVVPREPDERKDKGETC
jgi:hypothetical protein